MAGVTGKTVTLKDSEEDVANANNPQHAAKNFSSSAYHTEGDITVGKNDDDIRNKNANKPSIEMSTLGVNSSNSGPKTPVPGPSSGTATGGSGVKVERSKSEKEKKVGHRRVTQGGDVTYKKIQTSQIMGSIQLGVQHAIGGLASKPERDLLMQDFMTVEQTFFSSAGSNQTPAHHYSDFRFKTYAPIAFRYFRELFNIPPDDFLMSMCSVPMRELSNPGASGSIFYLTDDDEFIVKTVQHKECEFLQKLLPGYYMNLNQNPRTLLPKFFGLFCYQCNSKNVRLAVMNNLLPSSVIMHQKYDLKGSTYKRKASKPEREKKYPTFKDLDFLEHHPEGLLLEADTCTALIKTMQRDCRVLESFKIMDYSLLVGIHNLDIAAKEKAERKSKMFDSDDEDEEVGEFTPGTGLSRSKSINRQRLVAHSTALESIQAESEPIDADDDVPPGGIPARNAKGERLLLFLGLIDILQSYRLKKKLEHTFKAMIHDGDTVSVHRPGFYAERFMNFMTKSVFRKIPSLDLPEIKGNHRKFRNLVSTYLALKHSPSKKRGPPMRIRQPGEVGDGDFSVGSPPLVASPLSPSSTTSPPRITSPGDASSNNNPTPNNTQQFSQGVSKRSSTGASLSNALQQANNAKDSSNNTSKSNNHKESKERAHMTMTSPVSIVGGGGGLDLQTNSASGQSASHAGNPPGASSSATVPAPVQSPPSAYPAILNKESRPSSMNRGKIPPPVPPRTPKRTNGTTGTSSTDNKGVLDGSTPLPTNTPPPPFQEKASYYRGSMGSSPGGGGAVSGSSVPPHQLWNLSNSQGSPMRGAGGGGGTTSSSGAASTASSSEHHSRYHNLHGGGGGHPPLGATTSGGDSETVSISEVYVETRMHRSTLSVASSSTTSGVSSSLGHHRNVPRSPPTGSHHHHQSSNNSRNTSATPTWTEGTPSFTESSSSGDLGEDYLGCPASPVKGTTTVTRETINDVPRDTDETPEEKEDEMV